MRFGTRRRGGRRRLGWAGAALAASAIVAGGAAAQQQQQDFVVTATRTPTPIGQVGSSVTVITERDLELRQTRLVSEVLREVPGLEVNRSGGIGTLTAVRIRGAEANQVLVLIDGIEVSDVAAGSQFDFGTLTTDQIERIEVIRGAHSTVYGGEAIGGVIQIFTKRGRKGLRANVMTEYGSFDSAKIGGLISGGGKRYSFAAGASLFNTDGFSVADQRLGFREKDGYRNLTASTKGTVRPADWLELSGVFRFVKTRTELDTGFVPGFNFADDDGEQETLQYFAKAQGRLILFKKKWEQIFRYGFARTVRKSLNTGNVETFTASSHRHKFETQSIIRPFKRHVLTLGIEREIERARFTNGPGQLVKELGINGYYIQYQATVFKRLHLTGGVRVDDNERFGLQDSYRIAGVYDHKETRTKLKASYGTGFKSPTLSELFFSNPAFLFVGNPNLGPEFARTWDVGIEQRFWSGKAKIGVTYFRSKISDLIQSQSIGGGFRQPFNVGRASTHGIEVEGVVRPLEGLRLSANYTWLVAQDDQTDSQLLRRPKHSANFNATYRPPWLRKLTTNLNIHYRGTSVDDNFGTFPAQRVGLPSAVLVNVAASYEVVKGVKLFGRVTNLTDNKYQEVFGTGTAGRAFFGGVRVSLSVLD